MFVATIPAAAYDLVLTDATYGRINAAALDQPRLYEVITDPAAAGTVKTWYNPDTGQLEPVVLTAFVDTGASSFAISQLNATGQYDQPDLALTTADFIGSYTDTGVGGEETGDVTRPFGVSVLGTPIDTSDSLDLASYVPYGDFNLWVRREVGTGEVISLYGFTLADPINLVGMPVIRQRRLMMDVTPILDPANAEGGLGTYLLAPGDTEPATQATVALRLLNFYPDQPPEGETFPSYTDNPVIPGVTLTQGNQSATGTWLLDTGAESTFVSFAMAQACGLVPASYASLDDFLADYTGPTSQIGGIGAPRTVPILEVDRLAVPTREGATLVWTHAAVLVLDIAGLDGVFGMNLLVPSVTVDAGDPLSGLSDYSPGPFTQIVIDTTNGEAPVMRLATPAAEGTVYGWLASHLSAARRIDPVAGTLYGDADADGLKNLVEYALGRDPTVPDASGALILSTITETDGQHLALTFTQPKALPDVTCHVETSGDLVTWQRGDAYVLRTAAVDNGATQTVTWTSTTTTSSTARQFMRLVVETTP